MWRIVYNPSSVSVCLMLRGDLNVNLKKGTLCASLGVRRQDKSNLSHPFAALPQSDPQGILQHLVPTCLPNASLKIQLGHLVPCQKLHYWKLHV